MDDFRLIRLTKMLTQSIVASPYVRLKRIFSEISMPVKDVTGMWSIDIHFRGDVHAVRQRWHAWHLSDDRIEIAHAKRCESMDSDPSKKFNFLWRMTVAMDTEVNKVLSVDMVVQQIGFDDEMSESDKKKVNSLIFPLFLIII